MCAIKNGDEIRCDFPSQLCPLVIYLVEKMSRFGSIRALWVLLQRRFTSMAGALDVSFCLSQRPSRRPTLGICYESGFF